VFSRLNVTKYLLYSFERCCEHLSKADLRVIPSSNVDRESILASVDRVEARAQDTGATMWIEHELALFETLNKAPAFYD